MRAQPRPTHPIYLFHGCRSGAEHHLAARLEELAREIETLRWITAYSRPSSADKDRRRFNQEGRLDVSVIADVIPARPLAYICGSPGFITSMIDALVELGMPRFDVFSEAFVSRSEVPAQLEPQTVTIAGTGQSFLWEPSTGPLLDAALAAGLTLPSGCRVGQCESCAVRVIKGRFAHLAEFDGEPDCCLTCQAVPLSALTIAV
jgi:ferredoxin-NADP reductase